MMVQFMCKHLLLSVTLGKPLAWLSAATYTKDVRELLVSRATMSPAQSEACLKIPCLWLRAAIGYMTVFHQEIACISLGERAK